MLKRGVLLINLGTPDNPGALAVARYLGQFLSDPRVIDLPAWARWLLLMGVILPFRSFKSAAAYRSIWQPGGDSPLRQHSTRLCAALSEALGPDYRVVLGMRYGKPSLKEAIEKLQTQGIDTLLVLPLFPQYANASTGSALAKTFNELIHYARLPSLQVISHFYANPHYTQALIQHTHPFMQDTRPDYLLMSYHGLPLRQVQAVESKPSCDPNTPCPAMAPSHAYCYRAQCYALSRQLAKGLGLRADQWGVAFQSRLGRTPWIRPYTDRVLPELRQKGVQRLAVVCPAFVADCLETLEEIGIRARKQWQALGGKALHLIPCLNSEPLWVQALAQIVREQFPADLSAYADF